MKISLFPGRMATGRSSSFGLLAAGCIFDVVSYMVAERMHEIGLRVAQGLVHRSKYTHSGAGKG